MRLKVTDAAPSNLSYPYVDGTLEAGDEFEVDEAKGSALLDTHDYLTEADIVLSEDEYTVEDADSDGGYDLEDETYDELYERASEYDIDGRSDMTKDELIDALLED